MPISATIKVISAKSSVTYKATGSMDLSFPAQTAKITPTFKNYKGGILGYSYFVTELQGSKTELGDVSGSFVVEQDGSVFTIRCKDDEIRTANTYRVTLELTLNDGNTVSSTINLKVKRTAVKLKLSSTKLTLNKLIGDEGSIAVSCATKGYAFTEPVIKQVIDKNKKSAEEQLDIRYKDGRLYVATNDDTVYGMTYTVALQANEKATPQNLTVNIPTEAKSKVRVSLKASGKIDVIRSGSTVTVTPTYKNLLSATPAEEALYIYSSADKYKESVNHLFDIQPNGNGGYSITRAEGVNLPTGTYKVKLVAKFGNMEVPSSLISMSVTMGSAKLNVRSSGTTLFAKDKNDRILIWFEATDAAVNEVSRVEIADKKTKFEIVEYGNGLFGIRFKEGEEPGSLSKSASLSLRVYLDGNHSTKYNTTAKIKLTIVK